ncbi:MAG: DUF6516 family protein [Cytophagales bacterium]
MVDVLSNFQSIIQEIRIEKYVEENEKYMLKGRVTFKDDSILIIKDYRFQNNDRKYSFHWMKSDNSMIVRWDNEPHWSKISTFPHHKHIETNENVFPSLEISLEQVLKCIQINF